ncbi:MAG: hypothetical protein ABH875_00445, partial [Candidatus Omnitrophota bacterium]
INLTEKVVKLPGFDNALDISGPDIYWRGAFYALDNYEAAEQLMDAVSMSLLDCSGISDTDKGTRDAARAPLSLTLDKPEPVLLALASWNYDKQHYFTIKIDNWTRFGAHSTEVNVVTDKLNLYTNFDYVKIVRLNMQKHIDSGGNLLDLVPKAGENYVSDPGPFVVLTSPMSKTKRYDKILELMVDDAKGELILPLPNRRGTKEYYPSLDWVEVAGSQLFNKHRDYDMSNQPISSCVWNIETSSFRNWYGCVDPSIPYSIIINPYIKVTRFDLQASSGYNFFMYNMLKCNLLHESLHAFHHLPGKTVDDEENIFQRFNDQLYLGGLGYLLYSQDTRENGYISLNIDPARKSPIFYQLLFGKSAEKAYHMPKKPIYIYKVDDQGEPQRIFDRTFYSYTINEAIIPDDIPRQQYSNLFYAVYLYHPVKKTVRQLPELEKWTKFVGPAALPPKTFKNGGYEPGRLRMRMYPGRYPSDDILQKRDLTLEKCQQLISAGFKVYIVAGLDLENRPYEYDASLYEVSEMPRSSRR